MCVCVLKGGGGGGDVGVGMDVDRVHTIPVHFSRSFLVMPLHVFVFDCSSRWTGLFFPIAISMHTYRRPAHKKKDVRSNGMDEKESQE